MFLTANTYLFNPLVTKALNRVSKSTISFTNEASKSQSKLNWQIFYILHPRH